MSETLDKENKEPELLYRLGKRNPLMVMIDFITYSFFYSCLPCLPRDILQRLDAGAGHPGFFVFG